MPVYWVELYSNNVLFVFAKKGVEVLSQGRIKQGLHEKQEHSDWNNNNVHGALAGFPHIREAPNPNAFLKTPTLSPTTNPFFPLFPNTPSPAQNLFSTKKTNPSLHSPPIKRNFPLKKFFFVLGIKSQKTSSYNPQTRKMKKRDGVGIGGFGRDIFSEIISKSERGDGIETGMRSVGCCCVDFSLGKGLI